MAHLVANSSGMQCNRVAAATSWQSLTAAHSTTTKENEGGYYYKAKRKWLKSTQMRPASVMNKVPVVLVGTLFIQHKTWQMGGTI